MGTADFNLQGKKECLDLCGWPLEEGIKSLDFKEGHTVSDPMFRSAVFNRLY